jgi:hypothetical protein
LLFRCIFLLFFSIPLAQPGFADRRIALVIGNANYRYANPLPNPINDALLLTKVLQAQGFEVSRLLDADQQTMKRAFSDFAARLQRAAPDVAALVYYAGYGVQYRGVNYLIPVDARLDTEAQLDIETLSTDTIMQAIGSTGSRLNIVILDACRNSPFRSFRAVTRGLAAIDAPQGTLVAFSTAPGQAARDGEAGSNSPYSAALSEMLRQPGLRIEDVFKRVRQRVNQETNGEQTPWESSSLVGDFYPAGGETTFTVPQFNPVPSFNPPPSEPPPPRTTRYYYVWDTRPPDDWLALRSEPSGRGGRRLAQLPNGTLLDVLEQRPDNRWRVRAIGWNMEGWVLSKQGNRVWVYCCRSQ